jgi:hypothetical protein
MPMSQQHSLQTLARAARRSSAPSYATLAKIVQVTACDGS